jgi:5-methylcytosine-specific restriction enzyme subunit McrC
MAYSSANKQIPIENIYYLLCYAWNRFQQGSVIDIRGTETNNLANLFATVLLRGIRHIMRRGLDRGYVPFTEEIRGIRGRVDIDTCVKKALWATGRIACSYDELTHDILHNQILKSTIVKLIKSEEIDLELRNNLIILRKLFGEIQEIQVNSLTFRKLQLQQNNSFYAFLMNVCEMVNEALLPEQKEGRFRFRDFIHDDKVMPRIFEQFLYNFYRLEQNSYKVSREWVSWQGIAGQDAHWRYLPQMRTDVFLTSREKTIVIDAKYYYETFQTFHEKKTIHSGHLYQMMAYLKNFAEYYQNLSGIIIYPSVTESISLKYTLLGHDLHIATIDLRMDWRSIRKALLELL